MGDEAELQRDLVVVAIAFEEGLMNVAEVGADLVAAGWQPGADPTPPPE